MIPEIYYRKIYWVFNFTAKRLDSEVMVEISDEFNKFLVWSWKRFKKLKKDSDKLYNLIKERRFDTSNGRVIHFLYCNVTRKTKENKS